MRKFYIYFLFLLLTSLPSFATNWTQIPNTNLYFDKDSIKNLDKNIYSVKIKSLVNNGLECRNILVINGNTQKFNFSDVELFDSKTQKVIKRKKYYDWQDITSGSNIYDLYQVILNISIPKTEDIIIPATLQLNTDIEMLMSSEYYKGIKVKSIKIKQVEVNQENQIKNNKFIEGEPNCVSVIIEITDTKGNVIELLGMQTLSQDDYCIIIKE